MGYLGGGKLKERLDSDLKVNPPPKTAPVWDVDLHMGNEAFVSSWDEVLRLVDGQTFCIPPGASALLLTEERLELPSDIVGFLSLKFRWKLKGLANISGFQVDPLYHGKIIFVVYNSGPRDVILRQGEDVFKIAFARVDGAVATKPTNSFSAIPAGYATDLKGQPVSVHQLDARIRTLEDILDRRKTRRDTAIQTGLAFVIGALSTLAAQYVWKLLFPGAGT